MKKGLIIIVMILVAMVVIANKENDDFIESCTEAGFTKEYCEAHK